MSAIFGRGIENVINKNYMQAISDHEVDSIVPWSKVGYSPASTTSETVVWGAGTDYIFPSSAMGMEVVSTDANDTANGTGARQVRINYLDSNFIEKVATVLLDGTTPVPTAELDIFRINGSCVIAWGSGLKPSGTITIRHLSDSPIYDRIDAGRNCSRSFFYTVPKNKLLFISNIFFSASANASSKRVLFTTMASYCSLTQTVVSNTFYPYTDITLVDSAINIDLQMPTIFPAGTDIKIALIGEAGAVCTCGARGWLKPI